MNPFKQFPGRRLQTAALLALAAGCSKPATTARSGPAFAVLTAKSSALTAQAPTSIDVNLDNKSAYPAEFVALDAATTVFAADDGLNGREVWKTDGTAAGTLLLKDIKSGSAGSNPQSFIAFGGKVVFKADSDLNGTELFVTDGTPGGTVMVPEISPGAGTSVFTLLGVVGGKLLFSGTTGSYDGAELWSRDGDVTHTPVLVKDINASYYGSSYPKYASVLNGLMYFTANDGVEGEEPWVTDGTADGTRMLQAMVTLPYASYGGSPFAYIAANATTVVFGGTATVGASNINALWKYETDTHAFSKVVDFNPASGISPNPIVYARLKVPDTFTGEDRHLVLFQATSAHGRQWWATDGTAAGTVELTSMAGSSETGNYWSVKAVVGNQFVFAARDVNGGGDELWATDGTVAGTAQVADLYPGQGAGEPNGSRPSYGYTLGQRVYFNARTDDSGVETKWYYDATTRTVHQLSAVPTSDFAGPGPNGTLLLQGIGSQGYELYVSDGTGAGTVQLKNINDTTEASSPANYTVMGDSIFFSATDAAHGEELWKMGKDGSSPTRVKDIGDGTAGCAPRSLSAVGGYLYFHCESLAEFWRTDGTEAGTVKLFSGNAGGAGAAAVGLGSTALFVAGADGGVELWKSDGTAAGTVRVKDIGPGLASGLDVNKRLTVLNGKVYFFANDGTGLTLWSSDGTSAGTASVLGSDALVTTAGVTQMRVLAGSDLAVWKDRLYFSVSFINNTVDCWNVVCADECVTNYDEYNCDDCLAGCEDRLPQAGGALWTSNGTAAGTKVLKSFGTAPGIDTTAFKAAGNSAYLLFAAQDETHGSDLWRTDGTAAGTSLVTEIAAGAYWPSLGLFATLGDSVLFRGDDGTHGVELWTSDGTAGGTHMVIDADTRDWRGWVDALQVDGPLAVFLSTDDVGDVVWVTDGTESGSVPVSRNDNRGSAVQWPHDIALFGARAFYSASSPELGDEPRFVKMTSLACPGSVTVEATGASGAPATYAAATASDPATITYSAASGSTFALGTTSVTATAVFTADGSSKSCSFNVVVVDTVRPSITCPASLTVGATSASGGPATFAASASDAVSTPTLSYSPDSGSSFPVGTTTVTATATDAAGNAATCSFAVTVRDTTAPTVTCPANVTAEATSAAGASVTYSPASAKDEYSSATVTYSSPSRSTFPLGRTTVKVTATDVAGNSATCTFTVTVADTTAPKITCPADITRKIPAKDLQDKGKRGAKVTMPEATATDAVSAPIISYSPTNDSVFSLGDTVVTATAVDAAGNQATCTFKVVMQSDGTVTEAKKSWFGCNAVNGSSASSLLMAVAALLRRRRTSRRA